jgi:hypothetical protein
MYLLVFVSIWSGCSMAQVADAHASPEVRNLTIEEGSITAVNLSPGYVTSVRLPEDVSSVVVGNPLTFKAEHTESEPRLVFLKPITLKSAESNALITTKSGQEISLHLISGGQVIAPSRVDFFLEYRQRQSLWLAPTRPVSAASIPDIQHRREKSDPIAESLAQQRAVGSPHWQGTTLQVSVGESVKRDHQTILGFSVLNNSKRTIELLPPQITLSGRSRNGKRKEIKAEPIGTAGFRMTTKRLEPGERADGVVIFERPAFKELTEKMELQVADSGQVDHPVRVLVPFVATSTGGAQ